MEYARTHEEEEEEEEEEGYDGVMEEPLATQADAVWAAPSERENAANKRLLVLRQGAEPPSSKRPRRAVAAALGKERGGGGWAAAHRRRIQSRKRFSAVSGMRTATTGRAGGEEGETELSEKLAALRRSLSAAAAAAAAAPPPPPCAAREKERTAAERAPARPPHLAPRRSSSAHAAAPTAKAVGSGKAEAMEDGDDDVRFSPPRRSQSAPVAALPPAAAAAAAPGSAGSPVRAPAPPLSPVRDTLLLQVVQMDCEPARSGAARSSAVTLRIYCLTPAGNTALVLARDFQPHFYVRVPGSERGARGRWDDFQVNQLMQWLDGRLRASRSGGGTLTAWKVVELRNLAGGHGSGVQRFVRVSVSSADGVRRCASILHRADPRQLPAGVAGPSGEALELFEANVDAVTRFCVDRDVTGAGWISVPAGQYRAVPPGRRTSACQLEVETRASSVSAARDPPLAIAPLVVASFDIECVSGSGRFPSADNADDPVVMVATTLLRHGDAEPFYRHLVTWREVPPGLAGPGCAVENVRDEAALLLAWRDFVVRSDPDVLCGYNVFNFDIPYMVRRAELLRVADRFLALGRARGELSTLEERTTSSKAHGTQTTKRLSVSGRVQVDLYHLVQREHNLASYTLNAVSSHFLGAQKDDVPYDQIAPLFFGEPEGRARLGRYCVRDTELPLRLMVHLQTVVNLVEMARVTGVMLSDLVTRGQQFKVFRQLCRAARLDGYAVPTPPPQARDAAAAQAGGAKAYQGATVIEPKKGFYASPVVTLDFASLYPSIMIAYNLSYETLVRSPPPGARFPSDRYHDFGGGGKARTVFARHDASRPGDEGRGLLPRVLLNLLAARKRAKKAMAEAKDPVTRAILNGRQLALKISCNSLYGFCGALAGYMPCVEIASTVTHIGRDLINNTKRIVEERYVPENGYPGRATVVYGDTDSVMVTFGLPDLERLTTADTAASEAGTGTGDGATTPGDARAMREAMRLGAEAAEVVTRTFPFPIVLEFEKVYRPYLLFSKKRYAGLMYESSPDAPDKTDVKGLQSVRRDSCLLLRETYDRCLELILRRANVLGAGQLVQSVVARLLDRRVPMHKLLLSKKLSKTEYAAKAPHVELWKRLVARDPGSAPQVGDRVSYVVVEQLQPGADGAGAGRLESGVADRAEDPTWVIEHDLPLDVHWYVDSQLRRPLTELFSPLLPHAGSRLFRGVQSRGRQKAFAPTSSLMRQFVRARPRCLGCNSPLRGSGGGAASRLCAQCEPLRAGVLATRQQGRADAQAESDRCWSKCRACAGSERFARACRNGDCETFYERALATKQLAKVVADIESLVGVA